MTDIDEKKRKYEEKAFLDYGEAADYLGIKRATLYKYVNLLKIKTYKFLLDRRRYLAIGDVKRLEEMKHTPWLAGSDNPNDLDDIPA